MCDRFHTAIMKTCSVSFMVLTNMVKDRFHFRTGIHEFSRCQRFTGIQIQKSFGKIREEIARFVFRVRKHRGRQREPKQLY